MTSSPGLQESLTGLAWLRALPLTERIARQRGQGLRPPADTDAAARRLARWRAQAPFHDDRWFAARLAADGITAGELPALLADQDGAGAGEPPAWWLELIAAYTPAAPRRPAQLPHDLGETAGFYPLVEPVLTWKLEQVRTRIAELAAGPGPVPFDPETVESLLLLHLPERLVGAVSRTLVLELNVARLEGRLTGDTAAERFRTFVDGLSRPGGMLALFEEYPVLGRQLLVRAKTWLDASVEFLEHLVADWPRLVDTFAGGSDPGVLTGLSGGIGDRHRGKEVLIAGFASGLEIVYKPRSMAVDTHFQELLAWLNVRGQEPPFRTLAVLDRGDHGWMELVVHAPCASRDEVARFYRRQGSYLALLYAIEASDFHSENLIASGEHPVLVDLESLFQARVGGMDAQLSDLLASHTLGHSVLQVGLLPQRVWGNQENEGVDLSGLGAVPGQMSPHGLPYWEAAGTDTMRLERRREELGDGNHRPWIPGEEIDLLAYEEPLVAGFTATYRLLMEHREALLAPGGPVARFAQDEVRAILRPTQTYGMVLMEAFHPDFLRDALDRDHHFDRLWVAIDNRAYLARVLPFERDDLWRGDIPIFTARPDSRDLFTSLGERLPEFFDQTGLELVEQRIRNLGREDLDKQVWFLRASLVATTTDLHTADWPSYQVAAPRSPADRDRLLAQAARLGEHLEKIAIRTVDEATWIGLITEMSGRHPALIPLKLDLYSGAPGLTLFLAHLGALTGEPRFTGLAQAALTGILRMMRKDPGLVSCIGGFGGWGGLIYTLSQLGVLWDDPALLHEAGGIAAQLPEKIAKDPYLDVIAGAGGCLGGLLALQAVSPADRTLAAAVACGDHLLARAVRPEPGVLGWPPSQRGGLPWGGLAHGNAGCALFLLQLATATGEERFRNAAREAMEYERALFNPAVGNWRDMRGLTDLRMAVRIEEEIYMTAWCHGSTGIGLARLAGLSHQDDPETRAEIEAALADTLASGFGQNHSLCHGDLGSLDLLHDASRRLDPVRWRPEVERLAASILDSMDERGWLCGVALGVETPGLMTGLAGIGYGLLRLVDPDRVPSVLVLEPSKIA